MKRDWDVIREVLLEVEALDAHTRDRHHYQVQVGQPAEGDAKAEHALLLYDAGYIDAIDTSSSDGTSILAPKLTWAGHELLDTIRSKTVWARIKTMAADKGLELTFDAVKALGKIAVDAVVAG